jgi:hypothetical protein
MRGERGNLTDVGCAPNEVLAGDNFICTYALKEAW